MKEWCVVQYVKGGMTQLRYGNAQDRRLGFPGINGIYEIPFTDGEQGRPGPDPYANPLDSRLNVFFVENEAEADHLIITLAKANTGRSYGKSRVLSVAVTPPGDPVISKFTEKGLLPS
jgi:hypothetical protein